MISLEFSLVIIWLNAMKSGSSLLEKIFDIISYTFMWLDCFNSYCLSFASVSRECRNGKIPETLKKFGKG